LAEAFVLGHVELALGVLGPVAAETGLLEDGRYIVDEADRPLLGWRLRRRLGCHRQQVEGQGHAEDGAEHAEAESRSHHDTETPGWDSQYGIPGGDSAVGSFNVSHYK